MIISTTMTLQKYKTKKLFTVREYKFKELVEIYKVDAKTLRKWMMLFEVKISLDGLYFKIRQVEAIKDTLGFPYFIYDIDCDLSDGEKKMMSKPFEVRPYKFKELCAMYNKHPTTMRRWLAPFKEQIGELIGGYYLIPQIEAIIEHIDLPYTITDATESEIEQGNPKQSKVA